MNVDLGGPLTLLGITIGRSAPRREPNPGRPLPVAVSKPRVTAARPLTATAKDWSTSGRLASDTHRPHTSSPTRPEMSARFDSNGRLAEIKGPPEAVERTILGLQELKYRTETLRMGILLELLLADLATESRARGVTAYRPSPG
jgi:hypothetical protein